jgi:hypothetical protein
VAPYVKPTSTDISIKALAEADAPFRIGDRYGVAGDTNVPLTFHRCGSARPLPSVCLAPKVIRHIDDISGSVSPCEDGVGARPIPKNDRRTRAAVPTPDRLRPLRRINLRPRSRSRRIFRPCRCPFCRCPPVFRHSPIRPTFRPSNCRVTSLRSSFLPRFPTSNCPPKFPCSSFPPTFRPSNCPRRSRRACGSSQAPARSARCSPRGAVTD